MKFGVKSMRFTLKDLSDCISFDQETHIMKVNGHEVGLIYFRAGYQAEQYTSQQDWETRSVLEISQAIKCPSIDYHLATFKKFQQSFCKKEILDKTLGERYKRHSGVLKGIFKGMWSLEDYAADLDV